MEIENSPVHINDGHSLKTWIETNFFCHNWPKSQRQPFCQSSFRQVWLRISIARWTVTLITFLVFFHLFTKVYCLSFTLIVRNTAARLLMCYSSSFYSQEREAQQSGKSGTAIHSSLRPDKKHSAVYLDEKPAWILI